MPDVIGKVTGLNATPAREPRRPGDPARVVASSELIGREPGRHARHDLTEMVASAWAGWRLRHGS
jgi:UDP-glucose 4-epimerase